MESTGWQKVNQVLSSLRSWKIGEQCENIVKLPAVFEEYPFPILVDAAFLKLGTIYRECNNNFIRFCILKVILTTTKHHHKIRGKDIFLRPVLSVIHSNDAVARAITLRVLGVTASLFPDRRDILHSIIRGLDSHVEIEREAAVFACKQYAALSHDVSKTVAPKLDTLMRSLATPTSLKVKVLDVFQSMDYDLDTAHQVRSLCLSLISDENCGVITEGCLKTLTQMMLSTLSNSDELLTLLFALAYNEPRKSLRLVAFQCLHDIARVQSALFTCQHVDKFTALDDPVTNEAAAGILYTLSRSPAKHILPRNMFHTLSAKLDTSLPTATVLFQTCSQLHDMNYNMLMIHFQPLLIKSIEVHEIELTKRLLLSYSRISHKGHDISPLVSLFLTILSSCDPEVFTQICYCLSALKAQFAPDVIRIADVLKSVVQSGDLLKCSYFCKLMLVLFNSPYSSSVSSQYSTHIAPVIRDFVEEAHECNPWTVYCISRVAMMNGMFGLGQEIFALLQDKQLHEHYRYYLTSLRLICDAEVILQSGEVKPALIKCIETYDLAVRSAGCGANTAQTQYQVSYLQLRHRLLKVYLQLVNVYNMSLLYGVDCTKQFQPTLNFISTQLLQFDAHIETIKSRMIDAPKDEVKLNELLAISHVLNVLCTGTVTEPQHTSTSHVFTVCCIILDTIKHDVSTLQSVSFIYQTLYKLIDVRFSLPLFYFIQPTATTITLATSPPIEEGVIKVVGGCDLVLTIEGVVRGNARAKRALIEVSCEGAKYSKGGTAVVLHNKEVEIENDYLKVELCVDVISSTQKFTIRASVIDERENVWDIGNELCFSVSIDDSVLSKAQLLSKAYSST